MIGVSSGIVHFCTGFCLSLWPLLGKSKSSWIQSQVLASQTTLCLSRKEKALLGDKGLLMVCWGRVQGRIPIPGRVLEHLEGSELQFQAASCLSA